MNSEFLEKLKNIMLRENSKYCYNLELIQYCRFSKCRICEKNNGSAEYVITNNEGIKFKFPEGLLHYYETHNVQPSEKFYEFIMKL